MALTKDKIKRALSKIDDPDKFADALAKAIVNNLDIRIKKGSVIVTVTGGGGLPAIGLPNQTDIKLEVN